MRNVTQGFTLLEIMVVVILISLLASLAGVHIVRRFQKSQIGIARTAVKSTLSTALQTFYIDNNFYPTTEQGLEALVEKPAGFPEPVEYDEEGYLDEVPLDPWGMPYQYASPGDHNRGRFDLWSTGPDRQSGTADDIVNWKQN